MGTLKKVLNKVIKTLLWLLGLIVLAALSMLTIGSAIGSAVFGTGNRAWKIVVSVDQLLNTALGGDEDETFSARCYRERHTKKYGKLMKFIDWVFLKVANEENHCKEAFETELSKSGSYLDKYLHVL